MQVPNALAVDSLYRSVRTLPNKLQYDYNRRRISQDNSDTISFSRLLSDGNMKNANKVNAEDALSRNRMLRTPLLTASTTDQYQYPITTSKEDIKKSSILAFQALSTISSLVQEGVLSGETIVLAPL